MQPLAFLWSQVDGPADKTATIAAPDQAKTTVTFDFPGDYTIELLVNDGQDVDNAATADVTITVTGKPASPPFRRGDVDGNGKLEITDAIRTLGWLFLGSTQPDCSDAADTNDDGKVDLSDPVTGLNYLFSGGVKPPLPGPDTCGTDPTDDTLTDCVYDKC